VNSSQGKGPGSGRNNSDAGDDAEIFRQLYPKLLAYAAVVADAGVEADDLVQEALVATLRSHQLVDLDYPLTYLRRAVLSAAIGGQRKSAIFRKYAPDLVDDDSRRPAYPSDLSDLDHLEPRDRAILYLVSVEGGSYAEVADLTGETEANARRRASRARQRLKEQIESEAAPTPKENDR